MNTTIRVYKEKIELMTQDIRIESKEIKENDNETKEAVKPLIESYKGNKIDLYW